MEKPNKIKTIRPETLEFISRYNELRGKAFTSNGELAQVLGFNNASSITEIIKRRQNIDPEKFRLFKERYGIVNTAPVNTESASVNYSAGIPMYNATPDTAVVGHMNFPGIEDCDFALPVWGDGMEPYLPNGCWVALKLMHDKKIVPGEVYYIEWGGHRMFRRLLMGDTVGEIIANSDNATAIPGGRLKYGSFSVKISEISKLALVKHIHRKV
ncbi:hypothetical protein BC343_16890 [Mucilaginibacter pedocola]|uniref:Peptidase S24/S26A/S26B/S26C domain-containing protein n=1 Tax=Mucilaginibacter pedocola TaxID=1792845 RepID=A0A1S9P8C0_9SPHI|nr:hypothetical protein BC343_16890 [Mucilaginibacter pedocola]